MNASGLAIAAGAAAIAGAINSAAGGGSFISFPTLVFLGVPPISANATNTVAMWIGQAGSIRGFRDDLRRPSARFAAAIAVSVAGGIAGAMLLLHTTLTAFNAIIPWLLLLSTIVFAVSPWLLRVTHREGGRDDVLWSSVVPLFAIAVYGGYFGGGQGLVMLAYFVLIGMTDPRRMNALKSVLAFVNNGVPVIPFVIAHAIEWDVALAMSAGAIVGGYFGARLILRIPPHITRAIIVGIGAATTVAFFLRRH